MDDLLFFEAAPSEPSVFPDVKEVANYVNALEYGIKRLETLPISTRLIKEIHERLMDGVRGGHFSPGEFRTTQNWIGAPGFTLNEAAYVPPPVDEMLEALSELEKYLNSETAEPLLVQCALMHYQFEAIHPFPDGNGRIGRLLITFFLCEREYLSQPLLYLSAFFERHRDEYFNRLMAVSKKGEWEDWLKFFLKGVKEQSKEAMETAKKILDLHERYKKRLEGRRLPKGSLRILDELFIFPVLSIHEMSRKLKMRFQTTQAVFDLFIELGILKEVTGRRRYRLFTAEELLKTINPVAGESKR